MNEPTEIVRHGIVGGGFGAEVHLPAVSTNKRLHKLALATKKPNYPKAIRHPVYFDWLEMINTEQLNSLSIAVPPLSQSEIAAEAMRLGLSVLCEKPFGSNLNEARNLFELSEQARGVHCVGFQYRYEPGVTLLSDVLWNEKYGKIHSLDFRWVTNGRSDPSRPWSWQNNADQGGGVIAAFGVHLVDLSFFLMKDAPIAVEASAGVLIPKRPSPDGTVVKDVTAEDYFEATLHFADCKKTSIYVNNCAKEPEGLSISAQFENNHITVFHQPPYKGDWQIKYASGQQKQVFSTIVNYDKNRHDTRVACVEKLFDDYFTAIISGEPNCYLPTFVDGLNAQIVLHALYRASKSDGAVSIGSFARNSA